MIKLTSKMMTHECVMMSLRIKNLKIDKFGDFSCDIDYSSRTDVFRYGISHIIGVASVGQGGALPPPLFIRNGTYIQHPRFRM